MVQTDASNLMKLKIVKRLLHLRTQSREPSQEAARGNPVHLLIKGAGKGLPRRSKPQPVRSRWECCQAPLPYDRSQIL